LVHESHPKKTNQLFGKTKKRAQGQRKEPPPLLRKIIKAISARHQGYGLKIAADVGPLRRTMSYFAGKEQGNRRVEKPIVARILSVARRLVFARHIYRLVQQFADREAPRPIWLRQGLGVDRIVRALAFRKFSCHTRGEKRFEVIYAIAGNGVHAPRLHVAGRRRTRGSFNNLTDNLFRNRRWQKSPTRIPG